MFGLNAKSDPVRQDRGHLDYDVPAASAAGPASLPKKLVLKPREPTPYGGSTNMQVFHKFALEAKSFLNGYNVEPQDHALRISHYLTGRAWDYYLNTVMNTASTWDIDRLLQGLFDYCFPVDYRQRQRERLESARQNGRSVKEFVHELTGLYSVLGNVPEHMRVLKLWHSLDPHLQEKLWWSGITPDTATWEQVRQTAELAEVAQAASESASKRNRTRPSSGEAPPRASSSTAKEDRAPSLRGARATVAYGRKGPAASPAARGGRPPSNRAPMPFGVPRMDMATRPPSSGRRGVPDARERAELLAAGKCFVCRETGHLSRNCPQASRVSSNRKSGAPGLTSFNVELAFGDAEKLRGLAESTAQLDELELCNLELLDIPDEIDTQSDTMSMPELEAVSDYDDDDLCSLTSEAQYSRDPGDLDDAFSALTLPSVWRRGTTRRHLGHDLYWHQASVVLEQNRPYFWDEVREASVDFYLEPQGDGAYHVYSGAGLDDPPELRPEWLRDPCFDVADWFRLEVLQQAGSCAGSSVPGTMGPVLANGTAAVLEEVFPDPRYRECDGPRRFDCVQVTGGVLIGDNYLQLNGVCPDELYGRPLFNLPDWYARQAAKALEDEPFDLDDLEGELRDLLDSAEAETTAYPLELNAAAVQGLPAVQRNAATPRDFKRLIPEPIVVVIDVNGHPARTLLDSGSLSDFMSSKLAHQLGIQTTELEKPLPVHLAVQGSRAKINLGCTAAIKYQNIMEQRYFDVINLLNYDLILGTPFLFQHRVTLGLNPTSVVVGSAAALPIEGKRVRVLESRAADIYADNLDAARQHLQDYAQDICVDASDSPLPPLRAINHTIPLKDPSKVYTWRPSKCPDAHRASWIEKRDAYLKSGRWRMSNARNTSPMLLLTKPG
ncbi:hypothetical protein BV20DRAFT_944780, partial [Pilatotrama ljubarskyi]